MPLSEGDVLNTLGDPVTKGMDFWVGPVHISGKSYDTIRDHVKAGNILVVGGTSTLAFYNSDTDILTTQVGTPPANVHQRGLLLHECTHALIDVFTNGLSVTRHIDELASYIAQHVYLMRSDPSWTPGSGSGPWPTFYNSITTLITNNGLQTVTGNGKRLGVDVLEPLRLQLAALPHVNYGSFKKTDLTGANGLKRTHFFLETHEEISVPYKVVAYETYPDPSDDYLIRTFLEKYAASDVAGYGARFRQLRMDFAKCSLPRARELAMRLAARKAGDRVSELFYDRLSRQGCAILLKVLQGRK
jgi:hypothetical protein